MLLVTTTRKQNSSAVTTFEARIRILIPKFCECKSGSHPREFKYFNWDGAKYQVVCGRVFVKKKKKGTAQNQQY